MRETFTESIAREHNELAEESREEASVGPRGRRGRSGGSLRSGPGNGAERGRLTVAAAGKS